MKIEWKPKSIDNFNGNVKDHISKVRGIPNINTYLSPTPDHVFDPYLLSNMKEASDRVIEAIKNQELICIYADVDPDGILSTVIVYDYIKRKLSGNAKILFHQRSEGHGVQEDKVPEETDLLLILDSSSNEVTACKKLSENMDIVIIDHHIVDEDNPHCILVNPQNDNYPNKNICTGVLAFKFVETLDFHFKKVDVHNYIDLVAVTLLADSIDLSVMENRYFVYEGMKNIQNIGLLALLKSKKKTPDKVDSTFLNYQIIPVVNTTTRNDEIEKAFKLFLQQDFKTAKKMADWIVEENEARKEKVKELVNYYKTIMYNGKVIVVVSSKASKNYNGLCAAMLSGEYKKPCLVLQNLGDTYEGSLRSYAGFDMLTFMKNCVYTTHAAGHAEAAGCGIKAEDYDKFISYIEDGLSEISFDPVIKYDIEIDEDDLGDVFEENKSNFELVEQIQEIDYVSGKGFEPITIRINSVVFGDRKLFGKDKHTEINAQHFTMKKFNDNEYGQELGDFDILDVIGSISINEFRGKRSIQLIIEDYRVH